MPPAAAQATDLQPLDAATVCPQQPHIGGKGRLFWEGGSADAPYTLTCGAVTMSNDGQTVTVRARTLEEAASAFSADAFLMSYYADLRVRVTNDGRVTADPVQNIPEGNVNAVAHANVTVTPKGGTPHTLLSNNVITPFTFGSANPFTVAFTLPELPVSWTSVTFDPVNGTIQAVLGPAW